MIHISKRPKGLLIVSDLLPSGISIFDINRSKIIGKITESVRLHFDTEDEYHSIILSFKDDAMYIMSSNFDYDKSLLLTCYYDHNDEPLKSSRVKYKDLDLGKDEVSFVQLPQQSWDAIMRMKNLVVNQTRSLKSSK